MDDECSTTETCSIDSRTKELTFYPYSYGRILTTFPSSLLVNNRRLAPKETVKLRKIICRREDKT